MLKIALEREFSVNVNSLTSHLLKSDRYIENKHFGIFYIKNLAFM